MSVTPCPKCQTLPRIEDRQGRLILSAEVAELSMKIADYLDATHQSFIREDSRTIVIDLPSYRDFINPLLESAVFLRHERESIRVLFLPQDEPLSPVKIGDVRTLNALQGIANAHELSALLDTGGLTSHFQPIVQLSTATVYGYEALVRGVADDGTLVYPDTLLAWARQGDMLFYFDRTCRETALKTAAIKNIKSKVFINFIPTAIYDPVHCLRDTVQWATSLNLDPKNVIFEVVESDRVEDITYLKKVLDYYKSKGFMVALDDFGSGYSNFQVLTTLVPDVVKIDRQIIAGIHEKTTNQITFKAMVQIAKDNGITVLAEGIEKKEELDFALAHGADLAQGYYFAKPAAEPLRKVNF